MQSYPPPINLNVAVASHRRYEEICHDVIIGVLSVFPCVKYKLTENGNPV